jgi:hypothetical protein
MLCARIFEEHCAFILLLRSSNRARLLAVGQSASLEPNVQMKAFKRWNQACQVALWAVLNALISVVLLGGYLHGWVRQNASITVGPDRHACWSIMSTAL